MEAKIKKEGEGRQGFINGFSVTCALFDNNMFNNIQVSTTKTWGNASVRTHSQAQLAPSMPTNL